MSEAKAEAQPNKVVMELTRNYVPLNASVDAPFGDCEIVGYQSDERKDVAGKIIEASQFVAGEMKPPAYAGVGFATKIWAGTRVRVPEAEAKAMHKKGIATRAFDD